MIKRVITLIMVIILGLTNATKPPSKDNIRPMDISEKNVVVNTSELGQPVNKLEANNQVDKKQENDINKSNEAQESNANNNSDVTQQSNDNNNSNESRQSSDKNNSHETQQSNDNNNLNEAQQSIGSNNPNETQQSSDTNNSDDVANDSREILLSFAGDCTIGTDESFSYINSFPYRFEKVGKDYSYFFKGVRDIFENDDLTLVNLETTLTEAKKKAQKTFRFKGPVSYVNILKEGSIEMVNISNNHIYDYLQTGFDETLKTLDEAEILYSGEGVIAYFEANGITVASIGYNGWSTGIRKSLESDIKKAKRKADIVIVSFHWGQERTYYPNQTQTTLGRNAIDYGADIVVGHHPHVVQGIEKYKDKYIVYSLGNFCFGGNRNPADKDTFIFQMKYTFENELNVKDEAEEPESILTLKKSEGTIIACSVSSVKNVNDFQPTILKGKDRERVIGRILEYSSKIIYGIKEDDVLIYNND